ncbi:hypothetical protein ACLMJK_003837 [Lecanora helva]
MGLCLNWSLKKNEFSNIESSRQREASRGPSSLESHHKQRPSYDNNGTLNSIELQKRIEQFSLGSNGSRRVVDPPTPVNNPFSEEPMGKAHDMAGYEGSDRHFITPSLSVSDQEELSSGSLGHEGLGEDPEMLLQPDTRPISTEQLAVEVKGIYAGLVMVEAKCIDIDERQSAAAQERDPAKRPELTNDQWQSLIALHKQLLHEHHDFFLASQHPSASPALSKLAAKYSMPTRLWRHGIHAFLEVLRHRLPESIEHMLAFIYIAYSMVALLYETVSAFEDTWVECLGDLGRYRMAIEDDEPRDREIWNNVAKFWYHKASDKTPSIGRLYHHLAVLARPFTMEQLSLYTRSLTCVIPFEPTKGTIMTLFNPVLQEKEAAQRWPFSIQTLLIKVHALLFTGRSKLYADQLNATMRELGLDNLFEKYIVKCGAKFKEIGQHIVTSAIAGLFEYGNAKDGKSKSGLRLAFEHTQIIKDQVAKAPSAKERGAVDPSLDEALLSELEESFTAGSINSAGIIPYSSKIASLSLSMCLQRSRDDNVYPLVHIHLAFIWSLVIVQEACKYFASNEIWKFIEKDTPWNEICLFLDDLAGDTPKTLSRVQDEDCPHFYEENGPRLPEDYIMRGL